MRPYLITAKLMRPSNMKWFPIPDLRKYFKLLYKNVYGNFNHRNNVSPVHLHALVGVGNFTKVIRVCADRL
jgi:hypothetical protein